MPKQKSNPLWEKLQSMKCFNLNDSFEVFFPQQLVIPYSRLEDAMLQYHDFDGAAIYMILKADRMELIDIDFAHDPPVIEYRNTATNEKHFLDNLWFFSHPVRRDALQMQIISSTQLEIGVKEEWRKRDEQLTEYTPVTIGIYDLITQSYRNKVTVTPYDILYIGSSKKVYHRLTNHETILKIFRHMAVSSPNQEIFVWFLKPKQKLHKQFGDALTRVNLSDSQWAKDGPFGLDVAPEALLYLAETMLIHYFKPAYNEQHVDQLPSLSHVTYAQLHKAGVQHVQVNLNLYMQVFQEILSLNTHSVNTNRAKHITIYGALKDLQKNAKGNILSAEVMPDALYDLFIGSSLGAE